MKRAGLSLIEVLVAVTVLATVMLGMALFQSASVKTNQSERDRAFAVQKAVQMMEEILAYQVTAGTAGERGIDALSNADGEFSALLTIDDMVEDPTNPLSGNVKFKDGYRFVRQIQVRPMPSEKNARRVTVAIYFGDGSATAKPAGSGKVLAMITNVVKAAAVKTQPTQVYDMYMVNIDNTIAVWSDPVTLEAIMASTIDFLQANNPGLEIRPHWIRRMAYGRDPFYSPLVNKAKPLSDTAANPLNDVFFYPGRVSTTAVKYNPEIMRAQMWLDGTKTNPVSFGRTTSRYYENQSAYTFADSFNHAVRAPQEAAKHTVAGGEMSLRMLLDQMAAGQLRNAIIVNLHAELIPVPPMRNYADAAGVPWDSDDDYVKDHFGVDADDADLAPGSRLRLVTHPRMMEVAKTSSPFFNETDTVDLQVFPYLAPREGHADGFKGLKTEFSKDHKYREAQVVVRRIRDDLLDWNPQGSPDKDVEIHVLHRVPNSEISSFKVKHTHVTTQNHYGAGNHNSVTGPSGFYGEHEHTVDNTKQGYYWVRIWPDQGAVTASMSGTDYSSELKSHYLSNLDLTTSDDTGKDISKWDLIVKLKNVPYTHLTTAGGYGLKDGVTLHGFNYFPDPALPTMDVAAPSGDPRNTARFRIRFKVKDLANPRLVEVLTTIGLEDKLQEHQYPNRSETYQWVGMSPPFSEQYQFVGDPRHVPYKDVRDGRRYNRYFANFSTSAYNASAAAWNQFPDTFDGWGPERNEADLPRYFELWRRALNGATGLFLNPAGFSFYYYGLGGEFSETLSSKPYTGAGGSTSVNEFTAESRFPTDGTWYAKPWLGELFPDNQWSAWRSRGNLPSATYQRERWSDLPSWMPSGANPNRVKVISAKGAGSFFNGGSTAGDDDWFAHAFLHGNTVITDNGKHVADSFKMYLGSEYPSYRPFNIAETVNYQPPEYLMPEAKGWRTKLEWGLITGAKGYYSQDNSAVHMAIAPIAIRRPAAKTAGYAMMAGFAPSGDSGTTTLARMSVAAAMQAFFDMGNPKWADGSNREHAAIKQLPRVAVTAPAQDAILTGGGTTLKWDTFWERWNTTPYSNQYSGYDANPYRPSLVFHVKYSADGGASWSFINNGPATAKGEYRADQAIANLQTAWDYSKLPRGEYLLMVEAYRDEPGALKTHYSYHTVGYVRQK